MRVAEQYQALVGQIASDFRDYRSKRTHDVSHMVFSERLAEIGFFLFESLSILLLIFPREDSDSILLRFQSAVNDWLNWQLSPDALPNQEKDIISVIPRIYQKNSAHFQHHHGCW